MDFDNVNIDYEALIEQIKNNQLNKFILGIIPDGDEKTKANIAKLFMTANKYGVSTETFMKIIIESTTHVGEDGYILPDDEDDEVSPY